jgi:hypothetical protein
LSGALESVVYYYNTLQEIKGDKENTMDRSLLQHGIDLWHVEMSSV